MNGELVRHWRGQEQRYLGPNMALYEYKVDKDSETDEVNSRRLRFKLKPAEFELEVGREAEVFVEQLRAQQFGDETIARYGLELASLDRDLGLAFAAEVFLLLKQDFTSEEVRIEVMTLMGYSKQAILGWHMSVDGYAANPKAMARLESLVSVLPDQTPAELGR
jgi:hypothetical protein